MNGQAITGRQDLVAVVGKAAIGDTLTLTVFRQGQTMELTIVVGEQIQSATESEQPQQQQQLPQFFPGFGY